MHTAYICGLIGALTSAVVFAACYIIGFAYAAGSWSFHWLRRQIKSAYRDGRQSGAFVCTTHLCSVPCPKPDATCSWSSDQGDVEAVMTFQGEKDDTGARRDAP